MNLEQQINKARRRAQAGIRERSYSQPSFEVREYFYCLSRTPEGIAVKTIKCPFCGKTMRTKLWGIGKRECECGAIHRQINSEKGQHPVEMKSYRNTISPTAEKTVKVKVSIRQNDIDELQKNYHVKKFTDYQYRINSEVDLYPTKKKYHILKTGERGFYYSATELLKHILS